MRLQGVSGHGGAQRWHVGQRTRQVATELNNVETLTEQSGRAGSAKGQREKVRGCVGIGLMASE